MKNIVQEARRTSQRGDHQHLSSVAWQPPACHGVIGEKTYMGANNPLSGTLKRRCCDGWEPCQLSTAKWRRRIRPIKWKNLLGATTHPNIQDNCCPVEEWSIHVCLWNFPWREKQIFVTIVIVVIHLLWLIWLVGFDECNCKTVKG